MQRFESIEIRNLAVRERGFNVEAMVAELLAIVPSGDLVGLYQVALLDSRSQKDRTRWVGVYSNRDGRHALIELYLDAVFGEKVSRFDHALGNAVSRVRLAQTLYHQIGVHRAKMRGERGGLLGGPVLYGRYLMFRAFNPVKLLFYFPERLVRRWRHEVRKELGDPGNEGGAGRSGGKGLKVVR